MTNTDTIKSKNHGRDRSIFRGEDCVRCGRPEHKHDSREKLCPTLVSGTYKSDAQSTAEDK